MPAPTNIIDAVQQLYAGLTTWTGKPKTLWFGTPRAKNPDSTPVEYPLVKFTHLGTPADTTFERSAAENWRFLFEIFAADSQTALLIFDRIRFNGQDPDDAAGFWYPDSITLPAGYQFMGFQPEGDWRLDVLDGRNAPDAAATHHLTFNMLLVVDRTAF